MRVNEHNNEVNTLPKNYKWLAALMVIVLLLTDFAMSAGRVHAEQTAASVAAGITSIPAPEKNATRLTLPAVPDGFEIRVKSSSNEAVIPSMDAQIFPLETDTEVILVLEVTKVADQSKADTVPIKVIVPGVSSGTVVDKTALIGAISVAQSVYDAAVEGTEPGQYPFGSKEVLFVSIQTAQAVADNDNADQPEVDAAVAALNQAVHEFTESMIKGDGDFLDSVVLTADRTTLNLDGLARLSLSGTMKDGSPADLSQATVNYTVSNTNVIASVTPTGATSAELRAGTKLNSAGKATVTVNVTLNGVTKTDTATFEVNFAADRPSYHDYHQTLTMKMFMAANDGKVSLTFEQALESIRKIDQLTRGIPKIIYLVGWQFDGHDTGYPALNVVNPKLKRAQDAKAEDSLKWLMDEAFKYNTTVSLHINMLDASDQSPLWQTYLDADVIAREKDGSLRKYVWGYPISYTKEWEAGLTQQRIDALLELLPIGRAGTIHIDAFHQNIPKLEAGYISPYHGITSQEEAETQKKIIRYFYDKGVDVTAEFDKSYRVDPFIGLQRMAWHIRWSASEQFRIPASLYVGGDGGDDRLGTGMLGEGTIKSDPVNLKGFLEEFSLKTVPWYYLNRLDRISDSNGVVTFSNNVTSEKQGGKLIVKQAGRVMRDGDDIFFPALWNETANKEIIAYSKSGYENRQWTLPGDWSDVPAVDIYTIGLDGLQLLEKGKRLSGGMLALTLLPGQGVSIFPSDGVESQKPGPFRLISPENGAAGLNAANVAFGWEAADLADSYRLTVAEDSGFRTVIFDETVKATSYELKGVLANDKQYYWKITAQNEDSGEWTDNIDGPSSFHTAITKAPAAPGGLKAMRISAEMVKLAWQPSYAATSYSVYRKTAAPDGSGEFVLAASGIDGLEYTDMNAPKDEGRYIYTVTATNAIGESLQAEPIEAQAVVYLSDMDWTEIKNGKVATKKDTNASGRELIMNGTTYGKGIGSHPDATITYRFGGKYSRFSAMIGIDDQALENSKLPTNIKFAVYADGEKLYESPNITAKPYVEPMPIDLDIAGVDEFQLVLTGHAAGSNPQTTGYGDWADAKLELAETTAAIVAGEIRSIASPAKDAVTLTLPEVPAGFTVAVHSTDRPDVIAADGQIFPQDEETTVTLVLEVTKTADGSSALTKSIQVVVPAKSAAEDGEKPTWPSGSRVTASNVTKNSLTLTWTAAADNVGVTAYKAMFGGREIMLSGEVHSVDMTGLSAGTRYTFTVEAGDAAGNWSNDGPSVTVWTKSNEGGSGGSGSGGSTEGGTSGSGGSGGDASKDKAEENKPDNRESGGEGTADNGGTTGSNEGEGSSNVVLTDVSAHWAAASIAEAVKRGIVTGYDDGTFRPDGQVTRAEFAAMLSRALNLEGVGEGLTFADSDRIPAWAKPFVAQAVRAGIIKGYDDHKFRPERNMSRAEVAVMIVRALELPTDPNAALTFADADQIPAWARPQVAAAYEAGLMQGRGGNRFAPQANATRAEAVALILAMLNYKA